MSEAIFQITPLFGEGHCLHEDKPVRVRGYDNALKVIAWLGYQNFKMIEEKPKYALCRSRAFESLGEFYYGK